MKAGYNLEKSKKEGLVTKRMNEQIKIVLKLEYVITFW